MYLYTIICSLAFMDILLLCVVPPRVLYVLLGHKSFGFLSHIFSFQDRVSKIQ